MLSCEQAFGASAGEEKVYEPLHEDVQCTESEGLLEAPHRVKQRLHSVGSSFGP